MDIHHASENFSWLLKNKINTGSNQFPAISTSNEPTQFEQALLIAHRENEHLRHRNEQLAQALAEVSAKRTEAQHLARHDHLTGLPNRIVLREKLDHSIVDASQRKARLGTLFIDLNGFKQVNDNFGHLAGDKLLKVVASRIADCIRPDDIVCRYGGDEFVVLLSDVSSADVARIVADKIRERVGKRYFIDSQQIAVSASIGIAIYPEDGVHCQELLSCADASMYRDKEAQCGCSRDSSTSV